MFLFRSFMENESPDPEDPEIAALLDFTPVERKCERRGGWNAGSQRIYIAALARTGSADLAADAAGLTARGAYELCKKPDGAEFKAAWDAALALHAKRSVRAPPRPAPRPAPRAAAPPAPDAPASEEVDEQAFDELLVQYLLKLSQERSARLAGKIVEADFCVRQLTWLEVALDLGGKGPELLKRLKRGGHHVGEIVATPMSVLLGNVRRAAWAEAGEPERPEPPALGMHDDEISTGRANAYYRNRDGPDPDAFWRRQDEEAALAAQAQQAWEEKARADAAAWRARVEGGGDAEGKDDR